MTTERAPLRARLAARLLARLRLSQQLAIAAGLMAVLVVGATFGVLSVRLRASAATRFAEELGRSQRTLLRLQRRADEQMLRTAALVGDSPTLRAAMETYRMEVEHGTAPTRGEALRFTLQRAADEQLDGLPYDVLVVTDARGRVLAASARQGTPPAAGAALASIPALHHALDPTALVDSANLGVAALRDGYYGIAAAPILLDDFTIGALVVGERIDQAWVRALQTAFDGDIVVTAGARTIGTTVAAAAGVDTALRGAPPGGGATATIRAGREEYVVASLPLGATLQGERVTLHLLHSVTRSLDELTHPIERDFALFGIVGALGAALAAGLASRGVLAPLGRIVDAMRSSARSGDFRLAPAGAAPAAAPREIRWLADSYTQLVDALDVERAAVVRRTAELERTNERLVAQIEERERAERTLEERDRQLRQAQKLEAVGTLAGGVAHDFNNLLTVISGYTQIALGNLPADARAAADMREVKAAAQRAAQLTQQLLAFGRKQVLQPRRLDLNDVVRDMETMLRRLVGEHVELRTDLDPTIAHVEADPVQMEQVLMNLAINARDALPDGGEVLVATEAVPARDGRAAGVAIVVRDGGIGMDAATRERIFEPFFTTKEPGRGTGLGLATVYGIVRQSEGTIEVESAPGRGSTFRVILPAVSADAAAPDAAVLAPAARGSETVLLVEDEAPVRELAERVLRGRGYTVLSAGRGSEALAIAARHPGTIHLLLTDVVMPQMTGREVARRVRELRPQVRVVFMSGHSDDAVALHGQLDAGAAFLRKPFDPDDVARLVREVLDVDATPLEASHATR